MEIFADGRIYVARGERFPFVCPQCEHIMPWYPGTDLITCEKCDCHAPREDFNRATWDKIAQVN